MRIFIYLLIVLLGGVISVSAETPPLAQEYHIGKYPGIGELFHWGMTVSEIETVLDKKLSEVGQFKYQVQFDSDGIVFDATCVLPHDKLEALVLKFNMKPDQFRDYIEKLKMIFGNPTGVDGHTTAMQWKDDLNDTGIVIQEEKAGLYSVLVGIRKLKSPGFSERLGPSKISSLEGVELGMSADDFHNQYKNFEFQKLPKQEGMPDNSEVYQANLTVDLIQSEAFFEFNDQKLQYVMIYLPIKSTDDVTTSFENHLHFLRNFYGSPTSKGDNQVAWNDGKTEIRFGLHPFGTFVLSFEMIR